MTTPDSLTTITQELAAGMTLAKCHKCGCMRDALATLDAALPAVSDAETLRAQISDWQAQLQPQDYTCLGCAHCFPAVALNAFHAAYPDQDAAMIACGFEATTRTWPPVAGDYVVVGAGPVAVTTLASTELVAALAAHHPAGLCIIGKTETENIGIDKLIKNTITNPALRFLVVAGAESEGHRTGQTLLALGANGINAQGRVIGAVGRRPVLRNVTPDEVAAFRAQITLIDLVGCTDEAVIAAKIEALAASVQETTSDCGCSSCSCDDAAPQIAISTSPVIQAQAPAHIPLDKAGYFVILVDAARGVIMVEHYANDNTLLRTVEGADARSIYWTIIESGWITQLSHAAYVGKELARAASALHTGTPYVQDGA